MTCCCLEASRNSVVILMPGLLDWAIYFVYYGACGALRSDA